MDSKFVIFPGKLTSDSNFTLLMDSDLTLTLMADSDIGADALMDCLRARKTKN